MSQSQLVGTRNALTTLKSAPGTYALVLGSNSSGVIQIGSLGPLQVVPGFYVYVGSAMGPGGIRARLSHHLRPAPHPHWHIDYLRTRVDVEQVWFTYNSEPAEHQWAKCLVAMRGSSLPMPRFGSSDCACPSHLFFFKQCPSRRIVDLLLDGSSKRRKDSSNLD
jgi:Uri superfamily endonuclease